ncbi:hypothetical protein L7F22_053325 [Adiantum nelumboides]|nr:hypothetical protein [Adiantum nelumboides]
MGRAAMQSKFVPVNLNNSYGEGISPSPSSPSSSPSSSLTSSSGSVLHRARPHGGMVLLTRPSKSSHLGQQAPMLASPGLLHLHKENAKSVWNRQQAPIIFKPNLAPSVANEALAANQNLGGRPLLTPESTEVNCSSRTAAKTGSTSKQVPLLREEEFPSLRMVQCSHTRLQQEKLFGLEQEGKLLQSPHMKVYSLLTQKYSSFQSRPSKPLTGLDEDGWCKNDVQAARDRSENSVITCGENWIDDERETLKTSTGQLEKTTNYQGVWRGALGLNDQARRWEPVTSSKASISAADCLITPFNMRQARGPLAHSGAGNLKDIFQKNVLDSSVTPDDNWQSNKLRRLYGSSTDNICSLAEDKCLQAMQGGCYLEHNTKPCFNVESIFKLKLKDGRKNEDAEGDNFRDLERESFEAELEKVQEMLEQERLMVVEGQESLAKLSAMQDKEPALEEESDLQFEVDTDKVMEKNLQSHVELDVENCPEMKTMEGALKEAKPKSFREEERKLMLLEEERRKERATKKLLELEERIAMRKAEKGLAKATEHFSNKNRMMQPVYSVACDDVLKQEQLKPQHGPSVSVKLASLSIMHEDTSKAHGMLSCRTTGQVVASLPASGSLHGLDTAGMVSKDLEVFQAIEASKLDNIVQTYDKGLTVKSELAQSEKTSAEDTRPGMGTTTKDVSNGEQQCKEVQTGAFESLHKGAQSHHEHCDERTNEAFCCDAEVETQHNTTCKRDFNLTICTHRQSGGKSNRQGREHKLEGVSKSHYLDDMKQKLQGTECDEPEVAHVVTGVEFQEPFGQAVPNTVGKLSDITESSLKPSWLETKERLAEHKSLSVFFRSDPDSSDALSSLPATFRQPFSAVSVPLSESASFPVLTDEHQKQLSISAMDMYSAAPFLLHAIQVGSMQLPLVDDDDYWMRQLASLQCLRASALQFGQLSLPSTDKPLLMAGSALSGVGQTPEHHKREVEVCTCAQQATNLTRNCHQVFYSAKQSSLSNEVERVIGQADSVEAAVIQFGDLSSSELQTQFFRGKVLPCLSHANEKSLEHQASTEFSSPDTDNRSLKELDLPSNLVEDPVVNGHRPCHNVSTRGHIDEHALIPHFGFKEQHQAFLMTDRIGNAQVQKYELLPAFSCRKKRGNAGTYADVGGRKYWRACTMKMKYVKVSHLMPEKVMPGLETHNMPLYRNAGRLVYKRKELPECERICQTIQEPVSSLFSNATSILQNQHFEDSEACQRESEVSMSSNAVMVSKLQPENLPKKPEFVTVEKPAISYGVACVFKQQGIDTPYTVDDFIEVKSRRQLLRKQRPEENETKSGLKPCKTAAHQQRSSKVVQPQRGQCNYLK